MNDNYYYSAIGDIYHLCLSNKFDEIEDIVNAILDDCKNEDIIIDMLKVVVEYSINDILKTIFSKRLALFEHYTFEGIMFRFIALNNLHMFKYCYSLSFFETNDNQMVCHAVSFNRFEFLKFLVEERGCIVTGYDDEPIVIAAIQGYLNMIKYLVEKGADVCAQNNNVLIAACKGGHIHILEYLVLKGIDLSVRNGEALLTASRHGRMNVINFLLNRGLDIHTQNGKALYDSSIFLFDKNKAIITEFYIRQGLTINNKVLFRILKSCRSNMIYIVLSIYESRFKNLDMLHSISNDLFSNKYEFTRIALDYFYLKSRIKITLNAILKHNVPHIVLNILSFFQYER
jgi:hypothetical protein